MNAINTAALATVFLVFYALVALQPVRLSVTKRISFAPLDTIAQVVVPRHVDNFYLCITLWYGGEEEDKGCWTLNGNSSPVFTRKWRMWEPGKHYGMAQLWRGKETFYSAIVPLTVVEGE